MARFAGSAVPQISGFRGYGRSKAVEFTPLNLDPETTDAASGASVVNVGSIYGNIRDKSPKYDEIANTAQKIRAAEEITGMEASAKMARAGIQAAGTIASAEEQAAALRDQASAKKKGGLFSAIGSIASAAIPLAMASDETMKDNIQPIEDALATLRQLRPVTFHYKPEYNSSPERMHHGFIAQEYQTVLPDATYRDESNGKLCIDPIDLIGLLVRANQQLETRIARLEAKQVLTAV
tara:strand:+ start:273 stop:983 length:711 start_codon:yes stop_codon:yes gene_type:complete